jgi:hypothetical protein
MEDFISEFVVSVKTLNLFKHNAAVLKEMSVKFPNTCSLLIEANEVAACSGTAEASEPVLHAKAPPSINWLRIRYRLIVTPLFKPAMIEDRAIFSSSTRFLPTAVRLQIIVEELKDTTDGRSIWSRTLQKA